RGWQAQAGPAGRASEVPATAWAFPAEDTMGPSLNPPDMGDRINRAWRRFVQKNIDGIALRRELASIDWSDYDISPDLYFFVIVGKHAGEPEIEHFEDPIVSDYFLGAPPSKLVAAILAFPAMTKRDLLEFDLAEETAFWDVPGWGAP